MSNHSVDDLYRLISYGKVVNSTSLFTLRKNNFEGYQRPVFFLSTGRCGTSWFTSLLSTDKKAKVFHVPQPELAAQSRLAYEILKEGKGDEQQSLLLSEVFLAGREELLLNCIKSNLRFIETDPRPTFFAPIIAKIWPESIFIHLYRHPAEVVRSGIQRHWYNTDASHELSRIFPSKSHPDYTKWQEYDQFEKISWLWNETNLFIEEFKSTLPGERYIDFNFNTLNNQSVKELIDFIQIDVKNASIDKMLNVKVNEQKTGNFPPYFSWDDTMKAKLTDICGLLMEKYNYHT